MRTAEEKNRNSYCLVNALSVSSLVQTESPGMSPRLCRAALAHRQLYSKVLGVQAIGLSLLPTASTNQPRPRGGRNRLTPKIRTNCGSLWSGKNQPQSTLYYILVTEAQLSVFGRVTVVFDMSLHRQKHVLAELGSCRRPGIIFAPSLTLSPQ